MNRPKTILQVPLLFLLVLSFQGFSQPVLRYEPVIRSLTNPVDIVNANDGNHRLFVVQKDGLIKVFDSTYQYIGDFLNVQGITTQGERGLLSLVFHPEYKKNGSFFIYYTNAQGNIEVSAYKVSSNLNEADPASKKIIITIPHPNASNHNGGKLQFGPDGYLYFATGDGGGGGDPFNNAQNGNSLLGKMIRIDIDNSTPPLNYRIPMDNPFIADPLIADEIWALGLRNPFRWSFDRLTGDMWIADVGQNAREEINYVKAGQHKGLNYGWRCYEGKFTYNTNNCQPISHYKVPVFDYPHSDIDGGFSVTGGFVYRGAEYPSLNGHYIFADFVSGNHWTIKDSANQVQTTKLEGNLPINIAGFGETETGALHACSLSDGIVYKIVVVTDVIYQLLNFTGIGNNNIASLSWTTVEQNLLQFEIEGSSDSVHFQQNAIVPAKNRTGNNLYSYSEPFTGDKIFYRLRVLSKNGKWDYSNTISVRNQQSDDTFIFPSIISNHIMSCFITGNFEVFQLFGINGSLIFEKDIRGVSGKMDIAVPGLSGVYFARLSGGMGRKTQRVFIH